MTLPSDPDAPDTSPGPLYDVMQRDLVALVESARHAVARRVNSLMSATYWEIGRRLIETEQQGSERAGYGEALIERLALDLTASLGRGFSTTNLRQMRAFHLAWPTNSIRQTLSGELPGRVALDPERLARLADAFPLPWSAYVALLGVRSESARAFYETEALRNGWSVRQLKRQIDSQFFERTTLSRDKAAMFNDANTPVRGDTMSAQEAIKDPFVLEFLDLKDTYSESEFEEALIERLADFLLELGDDFTFVGRQRRLRLDDTWFRVDLVFFHRTLRCLVLVDLKVRRFSYADAGQMHLYLNYAREHWMKPGENPPVGLILTTSKGESEARYALEGLSNQVLAAEYRTVLPDETVLTAALEQSRQVLAEKAQPGIDSGTDKDKD